MRMFAMRIGIVFLTMLFLHIYTNAQELIVVDPIHPCDFEIGHLGTKIKKDANGIKCALVKVQLPISDVSFEGPIINSEFRTNEYWVDISSGTSGTKRFKIKCPGFQVLDVDVTKEIPNGLQPDRIYAIKLSVPNQSNGLCTYTINDFNKDLASIDSLISNDKFPAAIDLLQLLSDSLSMLKFDTYKQLADNKINFCKRQTQLRNLNGKSAGKLNYGRLVFKRGDKYGIMDSIGNVLVKPNYDQILDYSNSVAWAKNDGKWGNLDLNGAIKVPFMYDAIAEYRGDHTEYSWLVAIIGEKAGFIDFRTGKTKLPFVYDITRGGSIGECFGFPGLSFESINGYIYIYNGQTKRTEVINEQDCTVYSEWDKNTFYDCYLGYNTFLVKRGKDNSLKYGLVDELGRNVLECKYNISRCNGVYHWLEVSDNQKFFSPKRIYSVRTRQFLTEFPVTYIDSWHNWRIYKANNLSGEIWININEDTCLTQPDDFRGVNYFNEVRENEATFVSTFSGKFYILNPNGKVIELPGTGYTDLNKKVVFKYGVNPFKINNKWGIVDLNGDIVVDPIYNNIPALYIENGVIVVETESNGKIFL